MAWDKSYSLVFTEDGKVFVHSVKSFEQPFKSPDVADIEPPFTGVTINGSSLSELVARKLNEILPPDSTSPEGAL